MAWNQLVIHLSFSVEILLYCIRLLLGPWSSSRYLCWGGWPLNPAFLACWLVINNICAPVSHWTMHSLLWISRILWIISCTFILLGFLPRSSLLAPSDAPPHRIWFPWVTWVGYPAAILLPFLRNIPIWVRGVKVCKSGDSVAMDTSSNGHISSLYAHFSVFPFIFYFSASLLLFLGLPQLLLSQPVMSSDDCCTGCHNTALLGCLTLHLITSDTWQLS